MRCLIWLDLMKGVSIWECQLNPEILQKNMGINHGFGFKAQHALSFKAQVTSVARLGRLKV